MINMYFVYILRSENYPDKTYIGLTQNIDQRLTAHNAGQSSYTAKYKPWKIETYIAFSQRSLAEKFERYLKVGSGKAFLNKRLI